MKVGNCRVPEDRTSGGIYEGERERGYRLTLGVTLFVAVCIRSYRATIGLQQTWSRIRFEKRKYGSQMIHVSTLKMKG